MPFPSSRSALRGALAVVTMSLTTTASAFERGAPFRDDFGASEPAPSASTPAVPKTPREGGTTEYGIGIAYTIFHFVYPAGGGDPRETVTVGFLGPSLPSLGIGGFLSKEWALLFRLTGTAVITRRTGVANGFVGPAFQHWPSERLMLGAGLGLGVATVGEMGIGSSARIGYSLTDNPAGSTRIAFELSRTDFGGGAAFTGTALNLEWQGF